MGIFGQHLYRAWRFSSSAGIVTSTASQPPLSVPNEYLTAMREFGQPAINAWGRCT
jgi:hypothetical protein